MMKVINDKTIHNEFELLAKLEEFCSFSSILKFYFTFKNIYYVEEGFKHFFHMFDNFKRFFENSQISCEKYSPLSRDMLNIMVGTRER